jgi:hypothetical protein
MIGGLRIDIGDRKCSHKEVKTEEPWVCRGICVSRELCCRSEEEV